MDSELIVLGAAFLLAGLLARFGRRIGLPTIPLFMVAGMVAGPNTPGIVLFDRPGEIEILASFGLIFLLFYLGIEFSVDDLTGGGRRLVLSAVAYLSINVIGSLIMGFAFGWGGREALVIAGIAGVSSSAIVTKLLIELRRLGNPESRLILSLAVMEDLFLAVYLAALSPVLGKADGFVDGLLLFVRAFAFLVVLGLIARFGARFVGRVIQSKDDELLVVLFVGFAFLVAGLAAQVGASTAIGAFLAGLILAETSSARRVERLVLPLRDAFGALFFFTFGLAIDPSEVISVIGYVLAAVVVTLVLVTTSGVVSARLNGFDRVTAGNIAFVVIARGEFALILVSLAAASGLDARLGAFAAGYVFILAVGGPLLAANSGRLSKIFPKALFPQQHSTEIAPAD